MPARAVVAGPPGAVLRGTRRAGGGLRGGLGGLGVPGVHGHRLGGAGDAGVSYLQSWAPQWTLFSGFLIGRLADGYEASFLVLASNPLDNFDAVTRIRMRFKQGQPLVVPGAGK
jgi:hypothetical protein